MLSRRHVFKLLGALSIAFAQGCAELLQPPPPSEAALTSTAPQAAPRAEAKPYGCANIRTSAPAQPPPVTLESLRSAVDSPDDATTTALLGQLGQAHVAQDGSEPHVWSHEYSAFGLRIEVQRAGDRKLIKSAELRSGSYQPSWAGPLPDGLSFAMDVRDTFSALGLPDEKRMRTFAHAPHYYRTRGLMVRFNTDGCLASVGFIRRIPAGTIRFDDVTANATKAEMGVTGIHVGVTRALGEWGDPNAPMNLALALRDEKGEPVHAFGADGSDAGPLRVEQNDFAEGEIRRAFFVSFSSMRLAPGPHTLHIELSARAVDASGASVPLPADARGPSDITFEMPLLRRARVGVLHVEVKPGVYDSGDPNFHIAAPDLRWVTASGSLGPFHSFTSTTHEDTHSASWSELTPWIVLAPDDLITLCVEDEDVLSAETIGCVALTLDNLISAAKERKPLSGRGVTRLILAAPLVSPAPKR